MRVRTRRFIRREHTTISGITMRFHPLIADADQALALQPVSGHSGQGAEGSGQMPVALGAHACPDGL